MIVVVLVPTKDGDRASALAKESGIGYANLIAGR
jgi:phosphopantothenate synthetase